MTPKLLTYFRSSASYRVRIALNVKGVDYDAVEIHLPKGEHVSNDYLETNPQGLVPALDLGGPVLTQSLAIIEYLDQKYPNPPLLPQDLIEATKVRALSQIICCDIHPLDNLRVLKYLRDVLHIDQSGVDMWYRHWIAEGFSALEKLVVQNLVDDPNYIFGETLSLADICLVPQMYNARRFKTDLSPYPTLVQIDAYLTTLKPFKDAAPESQVEQI